MSAGGRKVKMRGEGTRSSRVRFSRASHARLSPFPPLRAPATQARSIEISKRKINLSGRNVGYSSEPSARHN